jgi:hypothetical protein
MVKNNKKNIYYQEEHFQEEKINTFQQNPSIKTFIKDIIEDEFDFQYSSNIIDAKIEFEEALYNQHRLKTNFMNPKIPSLSHIMKKHSSQYDRIRDEVHKNKQKYLPSKF